MTVLLHDRYLPEQFASPTPNQLWNLLRDLQRVDTPDLPSQAKNQRLSPYIVFEVAAEHSYYEASIPLDVTIKLIRASPSLSRQSTA